MNACTIEKNQNDVSRAEPTLPTPEYIPAVDIVETGGEYVLYADLPGSSAGDVDIHYENDTLTLRAKVQPRNDQPRYLLQEYGVGNYARSFRIGEGIDPARITAQVSAGVLTLHLPKTDARRVRKIEVKTAD